MAFCKVVQVLVEPSLAKSVATVWMAAASVLIFAASPEFMAPPLATATICRMLMSAGVAAAMMESTVETQAVEQAVENMASERARARAKRFFIKSSPVGLLKFRLLSGAGIDSRAQWPRSRPPFSLERPRSEEHTSE